jgi:hypothetical protein
LTSTAAGPSSSRISPSAARSAAGIGEVAGHEEWTRRALDERSGEGGAGFALEVEKRDLGPVLDKGCANAAGAAGDDHRSAFE